MADDVRQKVSAQLDDLLSPGETDSAYAKWANSDAAKRRLAEWAQEDQGDPILEEARRELLPGLLIVEEKFLQIPRQWARVFRRSHSRLDVERVAQARYVGLAKRDSPVSRDPYEGDDTRFVYNFEPQWVELGTAITRKQVDDGSYPQVFAPAALGLAECFAQHEEMSHANVLELGHVYNASTVGDGVALFSKDHPNGVYGYSNVYECAALDEDALREISGLATRMPLAGGGPARAKLISLVVPVELEFTASRLIKRLRDEADPEHLPGYLPREGYCVLDYLRNPKAWFVTTSVAGLISFERAPFRLDFKLDGDGLALKATQRYAAGHYNPRACFRAGPPG